MKCHLCESTSIQFTFSEHKGEEKFSQFYCKKCDLYQTIGKIAPVSPDFISLTAADLNESHLFTQRAHKYNAFLQWHESILATRTAPPQKPRILDIGCGVGGFLDFAALKNFETYGYDASLAHVEMAAQNHPNVRNCISPRQYLEQLPTLKNKFDFVTLWDVFEHIREPRELLREIHSTLTDDGLLFISVPNGAVNPLKIYLSNMRRSTTQLAPWEHVFYYTTKSLPELLRDEGYEVLRTTGITPYLRLPLTAKELTRRLAHHLLIRTRYSFQIGVLCKKSSKITSI